MKRKATKPAADAPTLNREAWLHKLTEALRPAFEAKGYTIPEVRLSVGFPSRGALSAKRRTIGQCWDGCVSSAGHAEIFISPLLGDVVEVAATVVHELGHAAVGCAAKYGPKFVKFAKALLLEGKPTATFAGEDFKTFIAPILAEVGPYPHAKMTPNPDRKKQSTRLKKASCVECGYTVRVTDKWLAIGPPHCPEHGETFVEGEDGDGEDEGGE